MIKKICAPVGVQVELTEQCNFHCFYCYNFWEESKKTSKVGLKLSLDNVRLIMQQIFLNKIPVVTITGGEPFMNKEALFLMIKLAQLHGVSISINTNFSLVREVDLIKISSITNNVSFLVSLPSADKYKYVKITKSSEYLYEKVIKNIKTALGFGFKVSVNMVLTKNNLNSLEETAQLSKTLGIRTFCATKALPNISVPSNRDFLLNTSEAIESINRIDEISKKIGLSVDILGCYPKCLLIKSNAFSRFLNRSCVAGCTTLTIGADGNVRPCSHMDKSYGNVFEESLKDIWNKMDDWKMDKFVPKECFGCLLFNTCRGGCRVNNPKNDLCEIDDYTDVNYFKLNESKIILPKSKIEKKVPLNGEFLANPNINFREEEFGFLIFGNEHNIIIQFVNKSVGNFLQFRKEKSISFSFLNFLDNSGAKTENEKTQVENLFYKFFKKRIVILKKEGGE